MKKIILHSLFYIACFASITSCSKSVKAPATKSAATTNTTNTTTSTQTKHKIRINKVIHAAGAAVQQPHIQAAIINRFYFA